MQQKAKNIDRWIKKEKEPEKMLREIGSWLCCVVYAMYCRYGTVLGGAAFT